MKIAVGGGVCKGWGGWKGRQQERDGELETGG